MDAEQWRRIQDIFSEALNLPPQERSGFLDQQCSGNLEVRREVDAMLAADGDVRQTLASMVKKAAVGFSADLSEREAHSDIGRMIGPYHLVRQIGRGGMGAVYQAIRVDDQFFKSVAIKLISRESYSPEALARFRTERQILATLEHPNIAALLDGGTTDDGVPYIVMDYIEGQPIVEYARRWNLSIPDRLDLFRQLCSAVQHAHQALIIHRDIKPSNVLVTIKGVPKLIDFGIAKILFTGLVPSPVDATLTLMRRMTPHYASPEQIRGETLTTTTDVYSLGVLLYELLVFESPYRLTGHTPHELEDAVCNTEPIRLSRMVKDNPKLRRQLSGDLENIASMALRKEPERRYQSVQQLSQDIQNYLDGLPVSARDQTLFYSAGKLIRRNKVSAAALVLLILSIVAGWVSTARQAHRTEERYSQVRKLANSLLFDLHKNIKGLPGSTAVRQQLVAIGLEYLNSLSKDSGGDVTLQWELAQAYELVGDVQGDPFGPNLGQYTSALESYRKSLQLAKTVAKVQNDIRFSNSVAWLHIKCGNLEIRTDKADTAIRSYQDALEILRSSEVRDRRKGEILVQAYEQLALAQRTESDTMAALENQRLAVAAADRNATEFPTPVSGLTLARTRGNLGDLLWVAGDLSGSWTAFQSAVAWMEKARAEAPDDPVRIEQMQIAYRRAGDILGNPSFFHMGEPAKAEVYHRKALELAERLAARDPENARAQRLLYDQLRRLAAVLRETRPAESAQLYERSLAGSIALWKKTPEDLASARALANTRLGRAQALAHQGRYESALSDLDLALAQYREIVRRDPHRQLSQEDLLDCLSVRGAVQTASRRYDAARQSLTEAIAIAGSLSKLGKIGMYEERCLALTEAAMGDLERTLANQSHGAETARYRSEAAIHYGKALAIWARWRTQNLAVPYSSHEEQSVLRELAALEKPRPIPAR